MALIEITNVKKHYTSGEDVVEALRGVDISIEASEFITIMGQSGSGKSTLLSVLGGMNHPTSGDVEMAGVRLYDLPGEKLADFRAQNLGFVFQSFHLIPYLTAAENVMLPLAIVKMATNAKRAAAAKPLKRSVWGTSLAGSPTNYPEASRNVLPLPGLLSTIRIYFWLMSRPATWIPRPAKRSWHYSGS